MHAHHDAPRALISAMRHDAAAAAAAAALRRRFCSWSLAWTLPTPSHPRMAPSTPPLSTGRHWTGDAAMTCSDTCPRTRGWVEAGLHGMPRVCYELVSLVHQIRARCSACGHIPCPNHDNTGRPPQAQKGGRRGGVGWIGAGQGLSTFFGDDQVPRRCRRRCHCRWWPGSVRRARRLIRGTTSLGPFGNMDGGGGEDARSQGR